MAFNERRRDPSLSFTPSGMNGVVRVADGAGLWSPVQRMNERTRNRRSEYYCRIDASAFVGIMCALLILLMTPTEPFHSRRWGAVDLPRMIEHSRPLTGARREDAMSVGVARDGRVFFGPRRVTLDDLAEQIRDGLRGGAENRVYLAVDARAKYSDVKAVLDRIRDAGVEHVAFLTY